MLDSEFGRWLPGRRCTLSEERCFSDKCESLCYGLEVKKAIKRVSTGYLSKAALACQSLIEDLPDDIKKSVAQSFREGDGDISIFENFIDQLQDKE